MREILFRGKRADNEKWVEGLLVKQLDLDGKDELCIQTWKRDGEGVSSRVVAVIPSTVDQFTGLEDKNGKKIFEGDVVKVTDETGNTDFLYGGIGEVSFCDGLWYISGEVDDSLHDLMKWHYISVIGNIYDNLELLKGEE